MGIGALMGILPVTFWKNCWRVPLPPPYKPPFLHKLTLPQQHSFPCDPRSSKFTHIVFSPIKLYLVSKEKFELTTLVPISVDFHLMLILAW
jgi:hypothetical protein